MNNASNAKGVLTEMIGWHKGRLILVALLIMSGLVICVSAYDTGDLIQNFQYEGWACAGYGNRVWVDTDGLNNGATYGIYDTMVVFQTITGSGKSEYMEPWKHLYFYSAVKCNYVLGDPKDKGRLVIRFVDMLAPGFNENAPGTWKYKSVPRVKIYSSSDGSIASDETDPAMTYTQIRAYREIPQSGAVSYVMTGDPEHGMPFQFSERDYDFSDPAGIKELFVSTDYAENSLWKFHIITGTPQPATITVTSPNGGESWARGSNHAITWTSTGDVGSYVKIEVLKAGAVVQTLSPSTPNDGSYSWMIGTGLTTGTDYRIRITSTTNPAITDTSNNNFAITSGTAGTLTVTSPNGGESWVRGSNHAITWTSTGDVGSYVKIELLKAGVVVGILSSSTPNDGTYSWTISTGLASGTDYRIRITSTTNPAITDTSDGNFSFGTSGPIVVTSPNGGESWIRGSNYAITWMSTGTVGSYVKMEVLKAGVVVQTLSSSTPNDGTYSWTISTGLATGTDYRIRITSTTNSAITDTSNSNFAITLPPPSITVTVPNGGQTWQRGTSHTVTWDYTGSPGTLVKITRLQGGVEVGTISASTSIGSGGHGSFVWNIGATGTTGNNCKVKIQSISQPAVNDTSDNYFTLLPASTLGSGSLIAGPFMRD